MRKFIPISIIAILLISYINYNKVDIFPNEIPTVKLIINEKNYNTKPGDGTWFDNKFEGGNSYITNPRDILNECSLLEVKSNEKINFKINYTDNIQQTTLYMLDSPQNKFNKIELENNVYEFNAPKDNGEYNYCFRIIWDDNHNFEYLFKIKVKD
ncbi:MULTISPECIES: hypothetical protein [unclassified Clostridium]|uniref:hypothetical protein n=1 Tax=unclassified Clostridium TaxID=2614128 RepID=UPI001D34A247|nr:MULTISPECIES: hypothetical protein [unclassified Clostridium]MBN1046765.1 hypothetical protein [Clostridium botulinum]